MYLWEDYMYNTFVKLSSNKEYIHIYVYVCGGGVMHCSSF